MQAKGAILLKVLLNRFHPGAGQSFFRGLPQEEGKEVLTQTTSSQEPASVISWSEDLIGRTHYSWLAPIVQQFPKAIQGHLVAALPEPQASGVTRLLKIPRFSESLSAVVKGFLMGQLYRRWNPAEAIHPQYLAHSSLSELLELSKPELIHMVDLLAMYDLADTIRHVVDKKNLKAVYLCLSAQKQHFLRICLHKKEKLEAPKIDLAKWDGDAAKLKSLLHRRGLLRLGKALCGQGRAFLWNIIHTLDTGRGKAIANHYLDDEIPGVTPLLAQQVVAVINFLKKKGDE